jgi:FAD/FMN-containing dehydrogenase
MPELISADVQTLRTTVTGEVLAPHDPGYDEARAVWNGDIDKHPAVIVRCASATDVSAAIGFARSHNLEISVRGGAHSMAGNSVTHGGLEIDLSAMRTVTVDPVAQRALVGGGATLADRDAATQAHGLATTGGIVGHTGVGGLTLGGGMGWLTRKAGLSVDNLVSAEVVTADGRILRASPEENSDLFWAIRGGGGNFGVVTAFEFRLQPVGPMVAFGLFFWSLERGTEVLRLARDLFATMPTDVNIIIAGVNAPPAPFVPEQHRLQPGYALLVTSFGSEQEHEAIAARIRAELPPLFDVVTPMPYVQLQQMFDEANAFGILGYDKGLYLEELSDDAIAVVAKQLPGKTCPLSALFFYRLDGAYCEVGEDDTAFGGGRSPRYCVFLIALADSPGGLAADRAWVRSFWTALQPHAMGIGGYVNGETEFPDDRVRSSYGPAKYERLARIKAAYDPDNVFHLNANIRPATGRPDSEPQAGDGPAADAVITLPSETSVKG